MVKPAGTGRPKLVISARLAPLPPSRFFIDAAPSVPLGPNEKTYFSAFAMGATSSSDFDRCPPCCAATPGAAVALERFAGTNEPMYQPNWQSSTGGKSLPAKD